MNFLKKVWTSIRDFEGYEEFAAGKVSKAIKYMIVLTIIFSAFIAVNFTYKFYTVTKEVQNYIQDNIEEISLKERKTSN